jgi:hypothetical protein
VSDTYAEASRMTREAIINDAVHAASALLAAGDIEGAKEVLYAPKVVRAQAALLPVQSNEGASS